MSNGQFGLEDAEFWDNPQKNRSAIIKTKTRAKDVGITIDAPNFASHGEKGTLPIGMLHFRSMVEDVQLDTENQMLMVAVRQEDNAMWCGQPLATGKTAGARPPKSMPKGAAATGFVSGYYVEDIRRSLGIEWKRQSLTMTALLRERISNTVTTVIGPSREDFHDAEVEAWVEARRRAEIPGPPAPVWPPLPVITDAITRTLDGGIDPFPNYKQRNESPPLPDGEGINFTIDRVAEVAPGKRCILRGAFRLPVTKFERVQFDPQTGRPFDVGCPGTTAVCRIHLVATGTKVVGPMVLSLRVPSYDPVPPDADGLVTGFFNIDLFNVPGMPRREDTYFFTAFSRGVVAGPVPVGLVKASSV